MALSEPILPSFSTFASPCRERGLQEVRAAGTSGAARTGGGQDRGRRGRLAQGSKNVGCGVVERRRRGLRALCCKTGSV